MRTHVGACRTHEGGRWGQAQTSLHKKQQQQQTQPQQELTRRHRKTGPHPAPPRDDLIIVDSIRIILYLLIKDKFTSTQETMGRNCARTIEQAHSDIDPSRLR